MLKTGDNLYLRFMDDTNVRILHKSVVASIADSGPAIELEKSDARLQPGVEVLVYYEMGDRFVQQMSRIERVERREPTPLVQLAITSDPIDTEARTHRHVAGACEDVIFFVDGEECPAQDLSEVGFAVTSQQSFAAGQTVALVEDTTTTGGSTLDAVDLVEAAGGKVARVLCLVDRGEGAIEKFAERGITLEPIYTREDLPI